MDANDEAGFLAKIIEQPDDDTHRLVFADWLDENGQPERAEFIRVQVALAQPNNGECYGCFCGRTGHDPAYLERHEGLPCRCQPAYTFSRGRERELLGDAKPGEIRHRAWEWFYAPLSGVQERVVRRGFIECVTCTAADWLAHGDAIRAAHPVTKVVLTTPLMLVDAAKLGRTIGETAEDILERRWKGVAFEFLPGAADLAVWRQAV